MNNALKVFFGKNKIEKLYSYDEFLILSEKRINNNITDSLSDHDRNLLEYAKINWQRTKRVEKTFKPNSELIKIIEKIEKPQTWLVITEDWCGDSAQNLGYFINYAKYSSKIEIIIILRDSNIEAVDEYFNSPTARSIPKIIGFDEAGKELFVWGARPKVAQDLVNQLKAEGYSNNEFNEKLHLWYGRNRGKELEKEIMGIFNNLN